MGKKTYEITVQLSGTATFTVKAFNKEDAESIIADKWDNDEIDERIEPEEFEILKVEEVDE